MWRAEKKGEKNESEGMQSPREKKKEEQVKQSGPQNQRKQGRWSQQEQLKYILFLQMNRKLFQTPKKRKENRIFKTMSDFIQTRDFIQCRSHHMKQLKAHKDKIRNIILFYKKCFDPQHYSSLLTKFQPISNVVYKTTHKIEHQDQKPLHEEPLPFLPIIQPAEIQQHERNLGSIEQTNEQQRILQNTNEDPNNLALFWVMLIVPQTSFVYWPLN